MPSWDCGSRWPFIAPHFIESKPDLIPLLAPLELVEAMHERKVLFVVELLVSLKSLVQLLTRQCTRYISNIMYKIIAYEQMQEI
jgi:hypothetical protein